MSITQNFMLCQKGNLQARQIRLIFYGTVCIDNFERLISCKWIMIIDHLIYIHIYLIYTYTFKSISQTLWSATFDHLPDIVGDILLFKAFNMDPIYFLL